jgi:Cu/Ag efflux pump CusA
MTTSAMIIGMLPLSLGWGAGLADRSPMGTVLIGGLLSSLVLTLVLVPVVYVWTLERRAYGAERVRAWTGTEDVEPNMRSPASPSPGTM